MFERAEPNGWVFSVEDIPAVSKQDGGAGAGGWGITCTSITSLPPSRLSRRSLLHFIMCLHAAWKKRQQCSAMVFFRSRPLLTSCYVHMLAVKKTTSQASVFLRSGLCCSLELRQKTRRKWNQQIQWVAGQIDDNWSETAFNKKGGWQPFCHYDV